ncbi:hypothetical protein Misp02_46990 [Microtetraspora sp. NBRC 16547]|nr:hypothetical protein Misp02_46990 [Microtetraspora sp. NBRC 16547]
MPNVMIGGGEVKSGVRPVPPHIPVGRPTPSSERSRRTARTTGERWCIPPPKIPGIPHTLRIPRTRAPGIPRTRRARAIPPTPPVPMASGPPHIRHRRRGSSRPQATARSRFLDKARG